MPESKEFSKAISTRYDALAGEQCCLSCGGAFSLTSINEGDICVDLGCGKGLDVLRMAAVAGESGKGYGIDISEGMMQTARENAKKLRISNVDFLKSPLESIALEDHIADVVISNCTINHSLDQGKVWQEIARILKPGGQFVVSDIFSMETVPDKYRNDPESVSQCWAGAVTKEEYISNINNAGLILQEVLEESMPYEKGEIKVASFTIKGEKP